MLVLQIKGASYGLNPAHSVGCGIGKGRMEKKMETTSWVYIRFSV